MDKNEMEESGISLGDIFRLIFSQKWLALIIAVVIAIASFLCFYFTNKLNSEYVISFSVDLPEAGETDSYYSYPGGSTKFYYTDYVSKDVLNKVKESNSDFADVDVDKMILSGISLNEKFESIQSTTGTGQEVNVTNRRIFEIRIKTSAFKDAETAHDFLVELALYPTNVFNELDIDYNIYLQKSDFDDALTFDAQIGYFQSEINILNTLCDSLLKINNSVAINSKRQEFNAWVSRIDLGALSTEASANYYLKDWETSIAKYRDQLVSLEDNIKDAQTNLDNVKEHLLELSNNSGVQANDAAAVIKDLQSQLTSLERRKETINNYINAYYDANGNEIAEHIANTNEFAKKLQAIYDEMTGEEGYIAQFTTLSREVYEKEATVNFLTPSDITVEQSMGLLKSMLFSIVIAVVVALIVAFIAGYIKSKKSKVKETQAVQLEIPVEDDIKEETNKE